MAGTQSGDGENDQFHESVPWSFSPEIRTQAFQQNALRVVTSGRNIALYINGTQIASLNESPPGGGQQFGFKATSPDSTANDWRFSQLNVMAEENFNTKDQFWDTDDATSKITEGKLIIMPAPSYGRTVLNGMSIPLKAELIADLRMSSGDELIQPGGIIFWAENLAKYTLFAVDANGAFEVTQLSNKHWTSVVKWAKNDAIKVGLNQVNRLKVLVNGRLCKGYINDQEVFDFDGQPPSRSQHFGLYGQSGAAQRCVWECPYYSVKFSD